VHTEVRSGDLTFCMPSKHAGRPGWIREGDAVAGVDATMPSATELRMTAFWRSSWRTRTSWPARAMNWPTVSRKPFRRGQQVGIFAHELAGEALDDGNDLISDTDGHGPSGAKPFRRAAVRRMNDGFWRRSAIQQALPCDQTVPGRP